MRVVAEVSLARVAANFERLVQCARAASQLNGGSRFHGAVAMVKCNAYGHGISPVARKLEGHSLVLALGVASLEEAAALRAAGIHKPVWVFSDTSPWSDAVRAQVFKHGLTPVLHTLEDLRRFLKSKGTRPAFHLKFNTGMNRLGISLADVSTVRGLLERSKARPEGICSHLASADEAASALTTDQVERFRNIVGEFSAFNISYIHCSNTEAIQAGKTLRIAEFCNVIRPGLGIYGYGGGGLKPAMKLRARVITARVLTPGDLVGYGATYRADHKVSQAVLSVGYGDGFLRRLSNCNILVGGSSVEVLGRVSMDLISLGMKAKAGSWVTLLGDNEEQGQHMAEAAGTVVYELLTAISARVPRRYRGERADEARAAMQ